MAEHTTVNISMPRTLKDFVDARMKMLGCGNVSEYFRHLVRLDLQRAEDERLADLAITSLEKGGGREWTPAYRDEFLARAMAKLTEQKRRRSKAG